MHPIVRHVTDNQVPRRIDSSGQASDAGRPRSVAGVPDSRRQGQHATAIEARQSVRSLRARIAPSVASEATEGPHHPAPPSVASSDKRPATQKDKVAATELAATTSIAMFMRSAEGPIFDNLTFKYEEDEDWPWAESPFIHIQRKVHKCGGKVLGSRFSINECDYVLVPDSSLPGSPEDTNKYFGPIDVLMEGETPKYLPLAWLEECLKQHGFIDPQAWLRLARNRPPGTGGTIVTTPYIRPEHISFPSNRWPLGGYKEWRSPQDRERGAKILDAMLKFEWEDKKKKDFFVKWLADNGGRDIQSFCKKYNALFGRLCAPWGIISREAYEVTRTPQPGGSKSETWSTSLAPPSRLEDTLDFSTEPDPSDATSPSITGARLLLGLIKSPPALPTVAPDKRVSPGGDRQIDNSNAVAGSSNHRIRVGSPSVQPQRPGGRPETKSPDPDSASVHDGVEFGLEIIAEMPSEIELASPVDLEHVRTFDGEHSRPSTIESSTLEDAGQAAIVLTPSHELQELDPPVPLSVPPPELPEHHTPDRSTADDQITIVKTTMGASKDSLSSAPSIRPIKRKISPSSLSDKSPLEVDVERVLLLKAQADDRINYALTVIEPGMPELWDDYRLMREDLAEPVLSYETAIAIKNYLESTDRRRLTPSVQVQLVDAFSYLLRRHMAGHKPVTNIPKRHKGDDGDPKSSIIHESIDDPHPSTTCLDQGLPAWLLTLNDSYNDVNLICVVPQTYSPTEAVLSSAMRRVHGGDERPLPSAGDRTQLGFTGDTENTPRDAAVECCIALECMTVVAANITRDGPLTDHSLGSSTDEIWQRARDLFRSCSDSTILRRILALSITLPQDDFV